MTLKLPDFSNLEEWDSQFHDFLGFPMTMGNLVCFWGAVHIKDILRQLIAARHPVTYSKLDTVQILQGMV